MNFFDDDSLRLPVSTHIVFDIETGPAWHPGDSVEAAKAYCQPLGIDYDPASIGPHPGEFDPFSVKLGKLKDPEKREAKIKDARENHASLISLHEAKAIGGEQSSWESIIDNAALSPITGSVLAIGFSQHGSCTIVNAAADTDESTILKLWWRAFELARGESQKLIGWNIANFDIPFLVWRSAAMGVEIPRGVYRGKWLSDSFVDLMDRWGRMYDPWKGQQSGSVQAKRIARFLGCSRPADEIEGKDFWRHFLGSESERSIAIRYLENDVTEETIIAKRLGVI